MDRGKLFIMYIINIAKPRTDLCGADDLEFLTTIHRLHSLKENSGSSSLNVSL